MVKTSDELSERISILAGVCQRLAQYIFIYESLFDCEDSIDLINRTAPNFFSRIGEALHTQIFVDVGTLSDSEKSGYREGGRLNISVPSVTANLEAENLSSPRVEDAKISFLNKCKEIRTFRSRFIAHRDDVSVRSQIDYAPEDGFQFPEIIELLQEFLDAVQDATGSTDSYTVRHADYPGSVNALLLCLRHLEADWLKVEQQVKLADRSSSFEHFFSQSNLKTRDKN